MKCKQVKYNLLQGPVSSGFIFLLDNIQLGTRSLRPLDKVIVSSISHAIKTDLSIKPRLPFSNLFPKAIFLAFIVKTSNEYQHLKRAIMTMIC